MGEMEGGTVGSAFRAVELKAFIRAVLSSEHPLYFPNFSLICLLLLSPLSHCNHSHL